MIKISNIQLLPLICLLMSIGLLNSCKKSDDVTSGQVQLLSFGPTGARHGDTLRFFGNNLTKVTSVNFAGTGAIVEKSAFITQTSQLILLKVPNQAEQGFVTLKTTDGDIVSKTRFNLEVAPTVTTLTSQSRPGENITLTGEYMNWVTRVTFANDKHVDTFVSKSQTQLVVKVPDDARTGPLVLSYGGTKPETIQTADTVKVTLPIANSFSPNPVRHTTNVTIAGTDLDLTKQVVFNGVSTPVTTFVSRSATQLVVTVPVGTRSGKVILVPASGVQSISTLDLNVLLPVATAFSPSQVKHADNLTITGTNLDLTQQILFNGLSTPVTTFVSQSATQLVVKVPAGAQSGKVTLITSDVPSVSIADLNLLMPSITTMSPNPVDPGTNLTITGANLNLVTSITFQNAPAVTTFVSQTATQIVVRVPNGLLRGKITLGVLNSTVTVQSNDVLEVTGAAPPPTIAFPFYNDAVTSNWNGYIGGGWGGTSNRDNTAPVREGSKSIRINYVGTNTYGSPFQLGGGNVNLAPYKTFHISVYGAPGSGGKTITIGINAVNGKFNINVVEGKWTDYSIPLSTLTTETTLKELWVQEYTGTGGYSIYIDAIGLNP